MLSSNTFEYQGRAQSEASTSISANANNGKGSTTATTNERGTRIQLTDDEQLLERSIGLMASKKFQMCARDYDRRSVIRKANSLGGPKMKLIPVRVIERLGRIPRSNEEYAEDALYLIGGDEQAASTEIVFFSHQWLRPNREEPAKSLPDSKDNCKAKALVEFARWRRDWVLTPHGFYPNILVWIDFCCHDQDNLDLGFSMLPIWTACCERFLRFETPTYHSRVWCRLEPLLSAKFSYADHHMVIHPNYINKWPDTGTHSESVLLDPRQGDLTDPNDAQKLEPLVALAVNSKVGSEAIVLGETTMKTFVL